MSNRASAVVRGLTVLCALSTTVLWGQDHPPVTSVKPPFSGAALPGQNKYLSPSRRMEPLSKEVQKWSGFSYTSDPTTLMPEVGYGFDSITSEVKLPCVVERDKDLEPPQSLGQDGHMNVEFVTDAESFSSQLNFSASASFGMGVFSADTSVNYFRSNKLTTYSSYLLISSTQRNQQQELADYHLTQAAQKVLKNKKTGLADFIKLCGDEYFVGKVTGGDILAILRALSSTDSEQSSINATLSASAYGNDVNASVSQQLQSLKSQGQLQIEITRHGPAEDWPHGTVDELLEYGRTFPSKVKAASTGAWPIEYQAIRYREVDQSITPEQSKFFDTESNYVRKLYTRRSAVTYVVGHPSDFAGFDPNKASKELDDLFDEISRVDQAALNCAADSGKCTPLNHKQIPLSPDRPGWVKIDPKRYTPAPVGGVFGDDAKLLEVQGFWFAHCDGNGNFLLSSPNQNNQITFTNRKTGVPQIAGVYQHPILLPPDNDASFMVVDGPPSKVPAVYLDNCPGDPSIAVRVSRPLYPEDFH